MPKIPTKPTRLETIADYALAIVLGLSIAFGLFVYVSWFLVFIKNPLERFPMIISKKSTVIKAPAIKTVAVTKSLFYAKMQKAKGARVYGPYHNDCIYIHTTKLAKA